METTRRHSLSHIDIICVLILASFLLLSYNLQVGGFLAQSNGTMQLDDPQQQEQQQQEQQQQEPEVEPQPRKDEDPVAVITGPDTIEAGETVTLDAHGSYDPDGGDLGYSWTYDLSANFESELRSESSLDITALESVVNGERVTVSLVVTDNEEDDSERKTKILEAVSTPSELIP